MLQSKKIKNIIAYIFFPRKAFLNICYLKKKHPTVDMQRKSINIYKTIFNFIDIPKTFLLTMKSNFEHVI